MTRQVRATKEYALTPRPCPSCNRLMDKEFLEERYRQRGKRISQALKKDVKTDSVFEKYGETIQAMRKAKFSYYEIAREIGCSVSTVSTYCRKNNLGGYVTEKKENNTWEFRSGLK